MSAPQIALISILSAFGVALLVFAAWLFLVAPSIPTRCNKKYRSVRFAHRGLHTNGVAENSMTAFAKAVDAGYGIELDIRLCKSGELVVFHDPTLTRVAGVDKRVIDLDLSELRELKLLGTPDTVPTFREVLALVSGKVPLLIEIKNGTDESGVAEKFLEEIEGYSGEYIVESFNPKALRTVRRARRDIPLGILSMAYMKEEEYRGKVLYRFLERLRTNFLFRPDFIAYRHTDSGVLALRLIRFIFRVPTFAWTVRSEEDEVLARQNGFDSVIFEKYIPKDK